MKSGIRPAWLISFIAILWLMPLSAEATNVRGQVVRYNPNNGSNYPLAGVRVDLWFYNGYQWLNGGYTVTDNSGFYYFGNLGPGANIQIQVFGNFYYPTIVGNVYPPYFQDIPWIVT